MATGAIRAGFETNQRIQRLFRQVVRPSAEVRRLRAEDRAARRWEIRRRFEPWPDSDRGSSERAAILKGEAQRLLVDAAPLAVETLIGIMESSRSSMAQVAAAKEVLERALGAEARAGLETSRRAERIDQAWKELLADRANP